VNIGALINWVKSVLNPSHCLRFLGMLVDTVSFRFFIPDDKIQKLDRLVQEMLSRDKKGEYPEATFRELASVVGKIMSMQIAVPAVRMMTHESYKLIRPEGEWDNATVLTKEVVEELMQVVQWIVQFNKVGNPIRRFCGMTELVLTVDAGSGYGWKLEGLVRSEQMSEDARFVAREWAHGEEELWQCWKELLAVKECLLEEKERLAGRFVLVRADATTTIRYINSGKGNSVFLSQVMRQIWDLCIKYSIALVAEHIAGERMISTGVDSMSRSGEFTVSRAVFRKFNKLSGYGVAAGFQGYTLDLFATKKTAQCKRFCTRGAKDGAVGDARTFDLSGRENVWACPPLPMLSVVVMMLIEAGVRATVVVPVWQTQPWFVLLREHAVRVMDIKWHQTAPIMMDVSDQKNKHVHAVDKYDFTAFVLAGKLPIPVSKSWDRHPVAQAGMRKRQRVVPALRQKRQHKAHVPTQIMTRSALSVGACFRPARVLSAFDGIGVSSLCLQRLTVPVQVVAVECDHDCRELTKLRFPENNSQWSDVHELLQAELMDSMHMIDLLIGGFPCQDVSTANKEGQGLSGEKSGMFFVCLKLAKAVKDGGGHFLLECTDFVGNHTHDFRQVAESLGVSPVILYASDVSAGYRRRAYWASFPILPMQVKAVVAQDIMEPGRTARNNKLPTAMAAGTRSWNTSRAVYGVDGRLGPLLTVEMERQMGLPDDFTYRQGVPDSVRHRQVGNAFQADVMEHILYSWVQYVQAVGEFDRVQGFPVQRRRPMRCVWDKEQNLGEADKPGPGPGQSGYSGGWNGPQGNSSAKRQREFIQRAAARESVRGTIRFAGIAPPAAAQVQRPRGGQSQAQ
jgi:hypothetical protein